MSQRVLRVVAWLHRARLGWLVGHRLLYLVYYSAQNATQNTTDGLAHGRVFRGRRAGVRREVVLETVRYDPTVPEAVVIAGRGANQDWYRHLLSVPTLEVRIGRRRWPRPTHRFLSPAETRQTLLAYQQAHPHAGRRLVSRLGLPTDPADPRWPEVAASVCGIGFATK